MSAYSRRRKNLLSLAAGRHVVATTGPNMFYLTGFFGAGVALVHPDETVVLTSKLEADRAKEMCKEAEVIVVEKWAEAAKEVVKLLPRGEVVADSGEMRFGSERFMANLGIFLEARRTKDETEVEKIRMACEKTNKLFEELSGALKPGRTEWEVAADVMRLATEQELVPSNSRSSLGPIIIASGPHGAYGHSELSGRRLKRGDFVVADLFFRFDGYNSDETRTFAIGSASAEMKMHYAAVREANEAALRAANAGTQCGEMNEAAVAVLRKHGMEMLLNHGIGHGVGLDLHELPKVAPGNQVRLRNADVITDEPGVYRVGKFGVRIEDTLVVRGRKPMVLTGFTKDLVTCG